MCILIQSYVSIVCYFLCVNENMAYVMSDAGENGVTTYYYTLSSLVTPKSNTFEFSLIIQAMSV